MCEGGMTRKDETRELWSGKRMEECMLMGNTEDNFIGL